MPQYKSVVKLESLALHKFCQICAKTCTALEQDGADIDSHEFESFLKRLPSSIIERLISSTLKIIAGQVRKNRRQKGLVKAVQCMPQNSIHKLDYGSLFTEVRLYGSVNTQLQHSIKSGFSRTPFLSELKLSSKCNDLMLIEIAKCCKDLEVLYIPLSDVSDRGLLALAGISLTGEVRQDLNHGCPKLRLLNVQDCMDVTPVGIASILRHMEHVQYLYYDKLFNALEIVFKLDIDYILGKKQLKICHVDQYGEFYQLETNKEEMAKAVAKVCPNLESFRFFISRNGCTALQYFKKIKHLQIETEDIGTEFRVLAPQSLQNLITLHLTFRTMSQFELVTIADVCRKIEVLRLIGNRILDEPYRPNSDHFTKLKFLELRIVKNFGEANVMNVPLDIDDEDDDEEVVEADSVSAKLLYFFLSFSFNLQELIVSGPLFLPEEQFFTDFMNVNPLTDIQRFCISPQNKCEVLNAKTAVDIIYALPNLNTIALQRWSMTAVEIKEIGDRLRKENLEMTIV